MSVLSDPENPKDVTKDLLKGIARQRRPIIAVDLDDVLCQTCVCAAECKHVYLFLLECLSNNDHGKGIIDGTGVA